MRGPAIVQRVLKSTRCDEVKAWDLRTWPCETPCVNFDHPRVVVTVSQTQEDCRSPALLPLQLQNGMGVLDFLVTVSSAAIQALVKKFTLRNFVVRVV